MKPKLPCAARLSYPLATALATLLTVSYVHAVAHYWDNNSTTTGFGSAGGTWGTSALWTLTSNGGPPHSGITLITTSDQANFGTDVASNGLGGGTITVSGTVDAASLRFGSQTTGNVILSGGTINLAPTTSIHVGAGSTTVHTISSTITGAGTSLTKTGNTLQLSANNSYIGQTIISTGTLILNNSTVLGGNNPGVNGTSSISMGANSTLRSDYAPADAGITDSYVYAPITLTAAGTNNFFIGNGNSTPLAESVRYNINGAIGGTAGANVVFGNTTASRNNADSIIVLGASSTYNGNTTIQAGNTANRINVISGAVNALPTTTILGFDGVAGSGSGRASIFDLNGNNQTLAGLTSPTAVADRTHRVTSATAATLTINNTADFTFAATSVTGADPGNAQISGAISLTKNGTGTFTLGAGNGHTFTGDTKISGGILVLGHANSIQNSAFDTGASIAGDATNGLRTSVTTLTLGGLKGGNDFATRFTSTTGGYTGLTALTLNPGAAASHSYSGDVGNGAGGMNLTKSGAGTQTLSGTNTHTGTTTVSAGTLALGATGSIATSSAVNLSAARTLDTTAQATYAIPAAQPVTFSINPTGSGSSGKIAAAGLNITNAVVTLTPTGTLDDPAYVLATYTSLTGASFAAPLPTVPTGYTLNYAYQGNKIALVQAGYAAWASLNGAGPNLGDDHDNDGVDNGVEYFLGGPAGNTTGFTPLPGVTDTAGVLSVTWTKGSGYGGVYTTHFVVETSTTLSGPWTTEIEDPNPGFTVTFPTANTVKYTFPGGPAYTGARFARLKVTGP